MGHVSIPADTTLKLEKLMEVKRFARRGRMVAYLVDREYDEHLRSGLIKEDGL